MLDRYFVMPETIDRIRASWIAESVEQYVTWMTERRYSSRTVCRRVPIVIRFGEYAREHGASSLDELPLHVDSFVSQWVGERAAKKSEDRRVSVAKEVRWPIEQMLGIVLSDFDGRGFPAKGHEYRQHRLRAQKADLPTEQAANTGWIGVLGVAASGI